MEYPGTQKDKDRWYAAQRANSSILRDVKQLVLGVSGLMLAMALLGLIITL